MVRFALYGEMKAKPGKEAEVEAFLKQGAEMAKQEKGTVTWYAIKEDDGSYGIFDTFEEEAGREAHLNGPIAQALMAKAEELFSEPPKIHKIAILRKSRLIRNPAIDLYATTSMLSSPSHERTRRCFHGTRNQLDKISSAPFA